MKIFEIHGEDIRLFCSICDDEIEVSNTEVSATLMDIQEDVYTLEIYCLKCALYQRRN
jgi:thymidine kinase